MQGSPAIDAGTSAVPDWPATDHTGNLRYDDPATPDAGFGPVTFADIGAVEYVSAPRDVAIEIPPPASFKGRRRLVMDPFDIPVTAPIVQAVATSYRAVTGQEPKKTRQRRTRSFVGNVHGIRPAHGLEQLPGKMAAGPGAGRTKIEGARFCFRKCDEFFHVAREHGWMHRQDIALERCLADRHEVPQRIVGKLRTHSGVDCERGGALQRTRARAQRDRDVEGGAQTGSRIISELVLSLDYRLDAKDGPRSRRSRLGSEGQLVNRTGDLGKRAKVCSGVDSVDTTGCGTENVARRRQ